MVLLPRIGEASSGSALLLVRLPFATPPPALSEPDPPPIPNLLPNERPAGKGGLERAVGAGCMHNIMYKSATLLIQDARFTTRLVRTCLQALRGLIIVAARVVVRGGDHLPALAVVGHVGCFTKLVPRIRRLVYHYLPITGTFASHSAGVDFRAFKSVI